MNEADETPTGGAEPGLRERPRVSVIIPVYNGAAGLALCLAALAKQSYPRDLMEVVVVDNASTEDVSRALPQDPRFALICEDRPGSYAARNAGVARATGTVLAFTDGDCVPDTEWITQGVAALCTEPRPDAVGGRIRLTFPAGRPLNGPLLYEDVTGFPQRRYVEELSFAATANLFVWADAFERVGPFDPCLRSGGDLNWGRRLTARGGRLVYSADAVVDHPARDTWAELARKTTRVAQGIADQRSDEDRATVRMLRDVAHDLRTATSVWWRVWRQPTPTGAWPKVELAAATSYVRLLRVGLRVRDHRRAPQPRQDAQR